LKSIKEYVVQCAEPDEEHKTDLLMFNFKTQMTDIEETFSDDEVSNNSDELARDTLNNSLLRPN